MSKRDDSSSKVTGSSNKRRAVNISRSRGLRTFKASPKAPRRLSDSSRSTRTFSWLALSSTSQSCHSPSPSICMGEFSEASPLKRRFMSVTSFSGTPRRVEIAFSCSGFKSPSSSAEIELFALRKLKNNRFWFAVVPIFTKDQERNTYSCMEARIHHMA